MIGTGPRHIRSVARYRRGVAANGAHGSSGGAAENTPDTDFGLAPAGVGSVAGPGRRLAGLLVDWGLAVLLSWALFDYSAIAVTLIFVADNLLLLSLFGATIGHAAVGLRLIPVQRRWHITLRVLVRTALLLTVLPAVLLDTNGRGLHDAAAGTALIRAR